MKLSIYKIAIGFGFCTLFFTACRKDSLERKPDKQLVVPSTLQDFDALLNNTTSVFGSNYFISSEVSAADYDITDEDYNGLSLARTRNLYIWKADIYEGSQDVPEWDKPYQQVFYCNVVLDGLGDIELNPHNEAEFNNIKGKALFYRGYAFYNILQVFAMAYQQGADQLPGIPLRLDADINRPTRRASLEESYRQALRDVEASITMLPTAQPYLTQPSRAAALALLAKIYLTIGDYRAAEEYAERALAVAPALLDFNELNLQVSFPFELLNRETLLYRGIPADRTFYAPMCKIRRDLYESYAADDLRKEAFFEVNADRSVSFKGNYTGSRNLFAGLAWDEVYLIKAEAAAANGNVEGALKALNTLLKTRWKAGSYKDITVATKEELLDMVWKERRKELLMRGIRWTDIKRLNAQMGAEIALERQLNGETVRLAPNDPRFVMPIPDYVIELTDIEQNRR